MVLLAHVQELARLLQERGEPVLAIRISWISRQWVLVFEQRLCLRFHNAVNRLTPNDPYMGRTTPLTSKRCILYIYSTNMGTEYFKHAVYSPFFFSSKCSLFHNANLFGSCVSHILYAGCAKIKKNNSDAKGLTVEERLLRSTFKLNTLYNIYLIIHKGMAPFKQRKFNK